MKSTIFNYFLVCKGPSNHDVGGGKGHRLGIGFKTGDFRFLKIGGATVERLTGKIDGTAFSRSMK